MTKLESITEIRLLTIHLQLEKDLYEDNKEELSDFQEEYENLLNRFYSENKDMIASQQYEAAKKDFDYFMQLVEMTWQYWKDDNGKLLH